MSREVINVGAAPNDGQGDPIRTSFIKTNNNFGELYARAQENPPGTLIGSVGDEAGMYAYDSLYFYYCFQDYDGSSVIWAQIPNTVLDAIEIRNGSSTVSIPTANGNVQIGVAGTGNLAVFTSTGAIINGDLTVTGNANLSGNIVGDRITNGTTSIEIPVTNGNATISVSGTSNLAVFANTGVSIAGNIAGSNLILPSGGRIRGDFSSFPISSGQRTVFQTTSTSANATTFVSAIPGSTNGNTLGAAFTAWANTDLGNSTAVGVFAYTNENQILCSSSGSAIENPLIFSFTSTGEAGRFLRSGNLGLGNTAPVDKLAVTGNVYVSGGVTASALRVNGTSTLAGNLMPAANIIYDIGNSTNRWNDIWLANSTIHLGNAQISANSTAFNFTTPTGGLLSLSGTTANLITTGTLTGGNITTGGGITATGNIFTNGVFIGNGSGLSGVVAVANVGAASQLTNGTTTLNIPVTDGNIIGNISGFTNLFEFSTVGLSAAGNVTANNISAGDLITGAQLSVSGNITSSGTFVGDGSGLVNVIANVGSASQLTSGTTQINIPVANGNIVANVGGSTNLFQWSTVGFSAQGNITGGNINTAGLVTATGNVTGGNLVTAGVATVAGNITGGNLVTAGVATVAGNITGGNVLTAGVISATGNITGNFLLGNGSQLSGIITSVANINSGTSIMEVISSGGNIQATIGGTANVQVISSAGVFVTGLQSITGNITAGNVLTGGTISAAGNVTAGNLSVGTGTIGIGAIENNNANGVGNIGTTTTRFNTVFALASSAQYADLAEYYLADQDYAAGTVVAFGGAQELTQCDKDHDVAVAGIISHKPAFEMNAGIQGDHPVALALAGRVPCQVQGPIRRGQMLVAAGSGRARAEINPRMGAVIGKALEDFDGTTGTIEVVVGRI